MPSSKVGPDPLVPHPKRPWSLIVFVFLPTALGVLAVAIVWRLSFVHTGGWAFYGVPLNIHDVLASAANQVGHGQVRERRAAVEVLGHYTWACPNLIPVTVPYLSAALADPDPGVKGTAAMLLGELGPHAASAVPALEAAKGSSVLYFDYLLGEAISEIRRRPPLNVNVGCTPITTEEFERRRRSLVGKPQPQPIRPPR